MAVRSHGQVLRAASQTSSRGLPPVHRYPTAPLCLAACVPIGTATRPIERAVAEFFETPPNNPAQQPAPATPSAATASKATRTQPQRAGGLSARPQPAPPEGRTPRLLRPSAG